MHRKWLLEIDESMLGRQQAVLSTSCSWFTGEGKGSYHLLSTSFEVELSF